MDASERLAAWLAGDLDADERIALEAELARDPELREALAAMERADRHLGGLASPEPSVGFDQRLDAAVAAELASLFATQDARTERMGSTGRTSPADAPAGSDEFTSRRGERERKRAARRSQTLIGVAAAAVVLAGSGVLLTSLGNGDDAAEVGTTLESFDTEESDDDGMMGPEAADGAAGPVVVADERDLSREDLDELLLADDLDGVASEGLEPDVGRDVAGSFQAELGARSAARQDAAAGDAEEDAGADETTRETTDDADVEADLEEDEPAADEPAADEPLAGPPSLTRDGTPLPGDLAADAVRCLDELLITDPDAIPVYVEFAGYDGAEVIVYGLVTEDPSTSRFSRTELWVLDRSTCQVLEFSQR